MGSHPSPGGRTEDTRSGQVWRRRRVPGHPVLRPRRSCSLGRGLVDGHTRSARSWDCGRGRSRWACSALQPATSTRRVPASDRRGGRLDELGLRGDERVLDIGCGRGAVLIAVAHRLPRGRAAGADIWQLRDQTGNSRAATEHQGRGPQRAPRDRGRRCPQPALSLGLVRRGAEQPRLQQHQPLARRRHEANRLDPLKLSQSVEPLAPHSATASRLEPKVGIEPTTYALPRRWLKWGRFQIRMRQTGRLGATHFRFFHRP